MRVLLDTCVLSELQKTNGLVSVHDFVKALPVNNIFISAISLGEIAKGIALLTEGNRKRGLLLWLNGLQAGYEQNIINIDTNISCIWGEITAKAQQKGRQISAGDGLIAAIALHHGLHVITRNVKDFEPTGALIINPWGDGNQGVSQ